MNLSNQNKLAKKLEKKSHQLYKLYNEGTSLKEIGIRYKVARTTIGRIFKKKNLKIRNRSESQKVFFNATQKKKIKEMVQTHTLTDISKKLKIGKTGLKTYLIDNNMREFQHVDTQGPPKALLKKIEDSLDKHYNDLINTSKTLKTKAKELKISTNILRTRFTDAGYKLRTLAKEHLVFQKLKNPNLNYDFFKKKSPERDYWVGFIAADGTIIDLKKDVKKKLRLAISLGEKDKKHPNKIRKLIRGGSVTKFDYSKYDGKYKSKKIKRYIKHGIAYKYQLDNTLICRDLIKLGITPRKTYTFKPHKTLVYSKDFWRGIIDGDGSLTNLNKTRGTNLDLGTASKNELKAYLTFLKSKKIKPIIQIKKNGNTFYAITISGIRARRIANYLYKDAPIPSRLDRKYNLYLQWKKRRVI